MTGRAGLGPLAQTANRIGLAKALPRGRRVPVLERPRPRKSRSWHRVDLGWRRRRAAPTSKS